MLRLNTDFIVIESSGIVGKNEIISFLKKSNLLKSLSLYYAKNEGVKIAPVALLLQNNEEILRQIIIAWHFPLMIRMDYSSYSQKKFLGGIPIYNEKNLIKAIEFLLSNNFYPILHPHLDRFEDIYSVGISISNKNYECIVEVVGKGFDASDLRLGNANPHETIMFNCNRNTILKRILLPDEQYKIQCLERKERISKLERYISFVNNTGRLLNSLEQFNESSKLDSIKDYSLPEKYIQLSNDDIYALFDISYKIKTQIIHNLPPSNNYVASLSYIQEYGWILWDIYGNWYYR